MTETIIINNERKFNSNFLQSYDLLSELLNKATALSVISLLDNFLSLSKSTIYHILYVLNDVLQQAKSYADELRSVDSK